MKTIAVYAGKGKHEKERTVLTTTCVHQVSKKWGSEREVYIPLLHLSSISFSYTAPVALLVLSAVGILAALFAYNSSNPALQQVWWVGIGPSVLFLLFYFIGRRQSLIMASGSEKIAVNVQGGNKEILERFARKAQEQQVAFLRVIYSGLSQGVREPAIQKAGSQPTATLPRQS